MPHGSDYYREWYKKNGRKLSEASKIASKRWQAANPEKLRAQRQVQAALRLKATIEPYISKKLYKPLTCAQCSRETRLSGHHNDYSKPLEVEWLCGSCHKLRHLQK